MINNYRTIWISDLHLGSTQCQSDVLLNFLKYNDSETLYLVGDIIDFWSLSKKMHWPTEHNTVIQKILRKAKHGTNVIYVPGNHDENVREYDDYVFGDIIVKNTCVHTTIDGKKYLVVHGDQFDNIAKYHKWIAKIGSDGYDFLLYMNRWIHAFRKVFGIHSHFSLAAYVKHKVKNLVQFISDYEDSIVQALKHHDVEGVICGHIHSPDLRVMENGFVYINTGDFVESCSAIVEHYDGQLELIKWLKYMPIR